MKLIHTTLAKNLSSIREFGLLLSFSRSTTRPSCWLHTRETNDWAETHVRTIHDAHSDEIVHIEVEIMGHDPIKGHGKGLFFICQDIPEHRIGKAFRVVREEIEV